MLHASYRPLPPKKEPLPQWGLVEPDSGIGEGYLSLDVVDGLHQDKAIPLFTSSWAARHFIESDDGTLELHRFTPREHCLQELSDILHYHRLLASPPVMFGVIDAENIHPVQGLRSFLLSVTLRDIHIAIANGIEDIFVQTLYVVNY